MSLTFVMVLRSSNGAAPYNAQWVDRLAVRAHEFLKPDRVVCLTDFEHWSGPYDFEPLVHNWPGWFSKIEICRPGLFAGPCLYVDLDSLILRPIPLLNPSLACLGKAGTSLALLDDFFTPTRPATGVMAWVPSPQTERIYHEFVARPQIRDGWSNGDGAFIGQFPHLRLQRLFPGAFQSWKVQERQRKPVTSSILCFHGKPKNCDFPPNHFVTKHWIGANKSSDQAR